MEIASEFSIFATATGYDDLSVEVVTEAKNRILDLIGVALGGYGLDFSQMVMKYVIETGGKPEATVILAGGKYPACNAAFANAVCSHALDLDDCHRFAGYHPGAPVIPSALAACEMCGASTKELIAGVVIGYEISIRVAKAINPSHLRRGFHTTGTVGTFGAAAAAGKIMGLTTEEMRSAFGIAGHLGSGLIQFTMTKPMNPAKAAMCGLMSAIFARKGAKGASTIFEGKNGFLQAVSDEVHMDIFTQDLGKIYEISRTSYKLHACCRHIHGPIDAALRICGQNGIRAADISRVSVESYPVALQICTKITQPDDISTAKFSMPFSLALAISKGDANPDKYSTVNIRDKEIQDLATRIEVSSNRKWESLYPGKRGVTVTIFTTDGIAYSDSLDLAKGEPENPLSLEELFDKFHLNATRVLTDHKALLLREKIMNLENLSIEEVTEMIAGEGYS